MNTWQSRDQSDRVNERNTCSDLNTCWALLIFHRTRSWLVVGGGGGSTAEEGEGHDVV